MAVLTDLGSPTLDALQPSFGRHLLAANKSPKTVKVYLAALRVLTEDLPPMERGSHALVLRIIRPALLQLPEGNRSVVVLAAGSAE